MLYRKVIAPAIDKVDNIVEGTALSLLTRGYTSSKSILGYTLGI